MFAIYDTQGRYLRSSLEELRRVRKPTSGKALVPTTKDTEGPVGEIANKTAPSSVTPEGIKAYREAREVPEREAILHAYQVMSHPVETVPIKLDIASALQLFRRLNYQQLPVLDERQRLVGLLAERDLLQFLDDRGGELVYQQGKYVADAISGEVITADPITDVRRVARVMMEYSLGAMPVVDERDTLVGLVSRSDILRGVSNDPPLSMWT
ncbi:MAG: CBS domain-containing protein [Halioglobus sp.]|nr:CBS domain-containing protein [Halioglobus sp.]